MINWTGSRMALQGSLSLQLEPAEFNPGQEQRPKLVNKRVCSEIAVPFNMLNVVSGVKQVRNGLR